MKANYLNFWKRGSLSILLVLAALSLNAQTLAKWTFEGNSAVPTLAQNVQVSNSIFKRNAADDTYTATYGLP
jgi:hypothetical protein